MPEMTGGQPVASRIVVSFILQMQLMLSFKSLIGVI